MPVQRRYVMPFCRHEPDGKILSGYVPLMRKWLISYILEVPGLEHVDFFNALKRAGAERIMPSHWILQSDKSAVQLRDHFTALLAVRDQLLVAELGQDIVWGTKDS